ncbi:hypothetical protein TL16_g03363 [Triparma laevis f. inornata]|uniref:PPM-type phosphatase domain-containing protein n=1 Tax=Triparma laevis f. inornata TaxID=1714386 RepID=A0A9W6ZWW2_9STRA|nr:hypothetical protein TL16_g03363 [Triparma laevis f. inornata]
MKGTPTPSGKNAKATAGFQPNLLQAGGSNPPIKLEGGGIAIVDRRSQPPCAEISGLYSNISTDDTEPLTEDVVSEVQALHLEQGQATIPSHNSHDGSEIIESSATPSRTSRTSSSKNNDTDPSSSSSSSRRHPFSTSLDFRAKPRKNKREGRRKTTTKMASLRRSFVDQSGEHHHRDPDNASETSSVMTSKGRASPVPSNPSTTPTSGSLRGRFGSMTQMQINEDGGIEANSNKKAAAKQPDAKPPHTETNPNQTTDETNTNTNLPPTTTTTTAEQNLELNARQSQRSVSSDLGSSSITSKGSKGSAKLASSLSGVMKSITSGFSKMRRPSFSIGISNKKDRRDSNSAESQPVKEARLSMHNLSIHDKRHTRNKALGTQQFLTDSSLHLGAKAAAHYQPPGEMPTRSERIAWEKLDEKPVRRVYKNFRTSCSFHTREGEHHANEDRYLTKMNVYNEPPHKRSTHLFGVFDGHGGPDCAMHLSKHFPELFIHNPSPANSPRDDKADIRKSLLRALAATSMKMEYNFCEWAIKNGDNSGACSLVVAIHDNYLAFASIGDCELLIISEEGRTVQRLNHPHRSSGEKERKRVEAAGGFVTRRRAMGVLEPSRTIGDIDVKRLCPGAIIAEPEVGIVDLKDLASRAEAAASMSNVVGGVQPTGGIREIVAVLATDGVFDVMDSYDVASNVMRSLQSKKDSKVAADILCKKAYKLGSQDDITAVVLSFQETGYFEETATTTTADVDAVVNTTTPTTGAIEKP